jgi:hypothetical protein
LGEKWLVTQCQATPIVPRALICPSKFVRRDDIIGIATQLVRDFQSMQQV